MSVFKTSVTITLQAASLGKCNQLLYDQTVEKRCMARDSGETAQHLDRPYTVSV